MTSEVSEKCIQDLCVDVNTSESIEETIKSNSKIECDSGIELIDASSVIFTASSDSDSLSDPVEINRQSPPDSANDDILENRCNTTFTRPLLLFSVQDNAMENIIAPDKHYKAVNSSQGNILEYTNEFHETSLPDISILNNVPVGSKPVNTINKILTNSSVSLNEHSLDCNKTMNSSPFSKSAENIALVEQNQTNINCNRIEMNTEKILLEFSSQKTKASATQKLLPENTTIDVRYNRLPKELSQDLGSIVKNVHGIFSSVSGSFKNVYTHSQRATAQKPAKVVAPVPNTKVMADIFEDEVSEKTTHVNSSEIHVKDELSLDSGASKGSSESENADLNDPKRDMLRLQIETLERILSEQRKENVSLRERVKQHAEELQRKDQMFKDLEIKMDLMSKRMEQAGREKDAAVMRYASVECSAIEAKRAADTSAKAERAALAEVELLNNKLKSAHSEKQRICQLYDDKCHELLNSEHEAAKVREELRELEGRLKWTQSKLRVEMEAYKDSSERVEKLNQQVAELETARDAVLINAADNTRSKQLEAELKEVCASMILCRHENEELEKQLSTVSQNLETCTRERDHATTTLERLEAEVEKLKASNLSLEAEAAELAGLRAQAALATSLGARLEHAEVELAAERARADTCATREASALHHSAALTAQHVELKARANQHEEAARALSVDNASLRERVAHLEAESVRAKEALNELQERRRRENKALARKVAELTEELTEANKKLEWEVGENNVLKKKHANAVKELNRELQRTLKRCEQLEAKIPQNDEPSTRTGSVSSLSSGESAQQEETSQNGHTEQQIPEIQTREPDRQALIERIVSLQRAAARRSERCDFLEEHAKQLTGELRAKSRLLRQLLSNMPAGALANQDSDRSKKEIARLGGGSVMAAVWGGNTAGMTLELSLEMNTRLQALLEDTLLKNITLKENMDTLGEEIARLKQQKLDITEQK